MAKLKIFSVRDSKTEVFLAPHFLAHTGQAIRSFTEAANNPDTQLCKYPSDFTLFELGEFDQETGVVTCYPHPNNLGQADNYKRKPSDSPELPFPPPKSDGIRPVAMAGGAN